MDDFIIGRQGRKVNGFYDIVMGLVSKYPGKVHFFQYNTGGVGEIIEVDKATKKKRLIRKVQRVPIDLMAALQRGDLRGTNEYRKCRLGTEEVFRCEGMDLSQYEAKNLYTDEQIATYLQDLVEGRRAFTEEIAQQGLRKEIRELAHRELDAIDARKIRVEQWAPPEKRDITAAEDRLPLSPYISPWEQRRPSKDLIPFGKR
jgi:phosphoenolpyruvate carboxykinase (ATP)